MEAHERIHALFQSSGLTGRELGKLFNVTDGAITNWRKGHRQPSLEALAKICEHFCVSADYVLGLSDIEKRGPASGAVNTCAIPVYRDAQGTHAPVPPEDEIARWLPYPRDIIEHAYEGKPEPWRAFAVEVTYDWLGFAMWPIKPGALLLCDRRIVDAPDAGVYLLRHHDRIVCRRIYYVDNQLIATADSRRVEHQPFAIDCSADQAHRHLIARVRLVTQPL